MDKTVHKQDALIEAVPLNGPCCDAPSAPEAPAVASSCCPSETAPTSSSSKPRRDWLLLGSGTIVALAYAIHLSGLGMLLPESLHHFTHGAFEFMNIMWWGLILGILFVGILDRVPRELVMSALGHGNGLNGVLRATGAGLLFDLCSHGILLVGLKLYERGATLGQMMAFLIASPWNSISLTIILIALVGLKWTLVFVVLSAVIAIVSGMIFERLVTRGVLPENPNRLDAGPQVAFWPEAKRQWSGIEWSPALARDIAIRGMKGSRMIMRWILFGVVLAAGVRALLPVEVFSTYFGPTLLGLGLTLVATTIIEVCSEGSSPIAADLMTRANAPGNSFTFLMAGVATDYTEIMGIKEYTKSWKIAFFLPLVTVPQVLALGVILNLMG